MFEFSIAHYLPIVGIYYSEENFVGARAGTLTMSRQVNVGPQRERELITLHDTLRF